MQLCSHNAHADVNYIYISRSVTIPAHTPPLVTAFHGKAHSLLWPHPGLGNPQACLPTQLGSRWDYSHWETGPAPPLLFSPFTSNKTHFKKKEKEGRGGEVRPHEIERNTPSGLSPPPFPPSGVSPSSTVPSPAPARGRCSWNSLWRWPKRACFKTSLPSWEPLCRHIPLAPGPQMHLTDPQPLRAAVG